MSARPCIAFACAHLDRRAPVRSQIAALSRRVDCRVFAFVTHDTVRAMADEVLAGARTAAIHPDRPVARRLSSPSRSFAGSRSGIERLALLDTRAVRRHRDACAPAGMADIDKVRAGGIDALIPELPARWTACRRTSTRADLVDLMASMARSIGDARTAQPAASDARPPRFARRPASGPRLPTLVALRPGGHGHAGWPNTRRMAATVCLARGWRSFEQCGHLSTIEQPDAVSRVLVEWLAATG